MDKRIYEDQEKVTAELQQLASADCAPSPRSGKCTLEENIDRAARELPDGWIIEINVEAGAGWVHLYDGCGNSTDVSGAGSINEQVSEAISYAREHS